MRLDDLPLPAAKRFTTGNALRLLVDGAEAFPAMLDAIEAARRTVHLETYILRPDRTGRRFAQALGAAAKRGCEVRLIFDAVGSRGIGWEFVRDLAASGVWVLEFNPLRPHNLFTSFQRRDHRKILVVDGRVGFIGGINIGDEYAPAAAGGEGWRDNHLRVEGPAAADLDALFTRLWNKHRGSKVPAPWPEPVEGGRSRVRIVANRTLVDRFRIRNAYVAALRRAKTSIDIANAYFIPDRGIRKHLKNAAARGVAVRLLVPSRSDVSAVLYASRKLFKELLQAGVRIFEYTGAILHTKTVLVDGAWCALGSYNMDHRSLAYNLEANLHALDPEFGAALREVFDRDFAASREIRLETWLKRPLREIWLERFFFAFRYWF